MTPSRSRMAVASLAAAAATALLAMPGSAPAAPALRAIPGSAPAAPSLLAMPGSAAGPSPGAWTDLGTVEPGVDPILSFSPTGAVALGAEVLEHGRPAGSRIDLASAAGGFANRPWRLSAPGAGHGAEPLSGLALSSDGFLAASFAGPRAPVLARVTPPPPSHFGRVQQLVRLGRADSDQATPATLTMLATARGEIVAAGTDDAGRLSTATLSARRTTFELRSGPSGLTASDAYALASDPAGDTFLAGDGATGCSAVAVRAPGGRLRSTYRTGNCGSATPNVFDAITATTGGRAALLTEDVSEAGNTATRLLIQTGRHGRFGAATQLGGALGGPVGLASDADGELTAEWTGCTPGPLENGRLTLTGCAVRAATGSVTHGFSAAAARGTTLLRATRDSTQSAVAADRGIVVSRCAGASCALYGFTARPGGGFRAAHRLTAGATRLITLTGDTHGDLLALWRDTRGRLLAATATASTGRWSTHLLSSTPVAAAQAAAAYGPRGRAVVAWSEGGHVRAATFATAGS